MTVEKKREFVIGGLYALLVVGLGYRIFQYLLPLLLPFLVGFAIAFALRGPVEYLERRVGKYGKLWPVVTLAAAYGLVGGLLVFCGWKGVLELGDLGQALPRIYGETVAPALEKLTAWLADFAGSFSPQLRQGFLSFTQSTGETVSALVAAGSGWEGASGSWGRGTNSRSGAPAGGCSARSASARSASARCQTKPAAMAITTTAATTAAMKRYRWKL